MIEPALVQANHPIRPSAGGFYFEITVINDGQVEERLAMLQGSFYCLPLT